MKTEQEIKKFLKECKDTDEVFGDSLETEDYAILRTQIDMLEWYLK